LGTCEFQVGLGYHVGICMHYFQNLNHVIV